MDTKSWIPNHGIIPNNRDLNPKQHPQTHKFQTSLPKFTIGKVRGRGTYEDAGRQLLNLYSIVISIRESESLFEAFAAHMLARDSFVFLSGFHRRHDR